MAALARWYMAMLEKSPMLTKGATGSFLFGLGDILGQNIDGTMAKGWDPARTGRMLLWGGPIYTPFAHVWYNKVLEKVVTGHGIKAVATKVVADQVVFAPLINPAIMTYAVLGSGGSLADAKAKVQKDFWPVMKSNWMVWPAVQVINFRFVPPALNIPYINVFVLGWSTYMSYMTAKK